MRGSIACNCAREVLAATDTLRKFASGPGVYPGPEVYEGLLRRFDGGHQFFHCRIGVELAVEMAGHHVVDGILDSRRRRMAMRHRTEERALLIGFGKIFYSFLAALVEGVVPHIGARRHRALDHIERRLELRVFYGRRHLQLRVLLFIADLEHHELVGIEGYRTLRAGETDTHEIDAGLLAGLQKFTLRPVAHDLHAGLAFDHH